MTKKQGKHDEKKTRSKRKNRNIAVVMAVLIVLTLMVPAEFFAAAKTVAATKTATIVKNATAAKIVTTGKPTTLAKIAAVVKTAAPAKTANTGEKAGSAKTAAAKKKTAAAKKVVPKKPALVSKITGVRKTWSVKYNREALKDKITVSPAYGRKVFLYYRNVQTGKWEKLAAYKTKNVKTAKLIITYPKRWRSCNTSKWRISLPKVSQNGSRAPLKAKIVGTTIHSQVISAPIGCVMEVNSGKVLYNKGMYDKHRVASITKLMTAMLFTENCGSLSKYYTYTKNAYVKDHQLMRVGDTFTAKDLIYMMMVQSYNEAANAAAVGVSGSKAAFVRKMNAKAKKLGMKRTHYMNAEGLDAAKNGKKNYSCAYDQALLARYIMKSSGYKTMKKAMRTKKRTVKSKSGKKIYLYRTNWRLGNKGNIGMKTGTDYCTLRNVKNKDRSMYCFCGCYNVGGKKYITVVLGASNRNASFTNTDKLRSFITYARKHNNYV
jgi:D-alanyl-D-alanine carboxypeptidase